MAVQYLDPPGGDKFLDLYDKFNNNADFFIVSVSQAANTVTMTTSGGGTFTIDLPAGVNQVLTGLVVTIGGAGPYTADYTAGTYQIAGENFAIIAGSLPIAAAHLTLNRIDVLVVDDTGTASILTGTPAAMPSAPTVLSTQLAVSHIYIPAAGIPIVIPPVAGIAAGLIEGEALKWSTVTGLWERNPDFIHTGATAQLTATTSIQAAAGDGILSLTSGQADLRFDDGSSEHYLNLAGTNIELGQGTGAEATVYANVNGGIRLKSATPASTTARLWQTSSILRWVADYIVTHTGAVLAVAVTTAITFLRDTGAGLSGGFSTNSTLTRMFHKDTTTTLDMQVKLDPATGYIELLQNDTTEVTVFANVDGGIKLKDSVPSGTTEKLYNDGGALYWDGALVCTAPCGGGGPLPTVSIDDSASPYAADPDVEGAIICYAASGDITVTLPAAPSADAEIFIKVGDDPNPTFNVTIDRNTNFIDGQALDLVLSNRAGVYLKWNNSNSWVIVSAQFYTRRLPVSSSQALTAAFYPTMVSVDTLTAAAPTSMTLPATPIDGQEFIIKDRTGAAVTYPIIVIGNGNTVDNAASRINNKAFASWTLRYCAADTNWEII